MIMIIYIYIYIYNEIMIKTGCIYAIQLVWNALDVENQKDKGE